MKKKAILFDLDGTLTDSGEGIINCAWMTLEKFGLPLPSRTEMRVFVGPPLTETFARFGVPENRLDEAIALYRSRYIPIGAYENTPYPGIRELLEHLQQDGYRLYVATSKPEAMSVRILEYFDLAKYFTRICGAATDRSRNTKEAVLAYLLQETGETDSTVMVGDTVYDVIGARALGIPCIGVSWGYGKPEDLTREGAYAIAEDAQQLLNLLTQ